VALQEAGIDVIGQYVNTYNQTEGLVMLYEKKAYYFPIQPIPIIMEIPVWKETETPRQNLSDTLKFFKAMKMNIEQNVKFDKINHRLFLVDTQLLVPLLFERNPSNTNLTDDLGMMESNTTVKLGANERVLYKHNVDVTEFGYKKFIYEISKAISISPENKLKLEEYISNNHTDDMIYFLNEMMMGKVVKRTVDEFIEQNLLQQCSAAAEGECNAQNMCGQDEDDEDNMCKMIVPKENYRYFIEKLAAQLLTNKTLHDDFFSGFQTFTLSKPTGETIFYSNNEFANYLRTEDFYDNKKLIQTQSLQHFDYTSPAF
jgi:hypothetical protein